MSTPAGPTGLLRYGQAGRYSGWDDRVVITALSGRRAGVVVPVRLANAAGLAITLEAGWLAVAPAGDGTTAVITSPVAVQVSVAPGDGEAERMDELRAEITDPEAARWSMGVVPEGASESGLVLGWVRVPPDAETAADMELISRGQDFSTGGAIPGPPGPPGPQGEIGPPGQATLIVGSFGAVRTPADLLVPPVDGGFIPAGWDGPGRPVNDVQVSAGWSLIYEPDSGLWTFVGEDSPSGEPWIHPGVISGPEGPPGPPGPDPDYGVGPWRTLAGTPPGMLTTSVFRYRLLGQLNSVQVDCVLHYNAGSGGGTWPGAMANDCWVSRPSDQPRMYQNQGNGPTPAAGQQLSRLQFNPSGAVSATFNSANQGGVSTFSLIIPKDDVSEALPRIRGTLEEEEPAPHDPEHPGRRPAPRRPRARRPTGVP